MAVYLCILRRRVRGILRRPTAALWPDIFFASFLYDVCIGGVTSGGASARRFECSPLRSSLQQFCRRAPKSRCHSGASVQIGQAVSCDGHWSLPHVGSAWLSRVARKRCLYLLVRENVLFFPYGRSVVMLRVLSHRACYVSCPRVLLCIPSECGYLATADPSASVFVGDGTIGSINSATTAICGVV